MEDQPPAHERPLAALDPHQMLRQQLVVDDAILDGDAGVDRRDGRDLAGGVVHLEQVGEMDGA